jgi:hypothetical protein
MQSIIWDAKSARLEVVLRFVHVLILWIVIYFTSKAHQQEYTETTIIGEKTPPRLWTFPFTVIIADAALYLLIVGVTLYMASTLHPVVASKGAFIIDKAFMHHFMSHYVIFATAFIFLGVWYTRAIKQSQNFHYVYDGLRGIRALAVLLFLSAVCLMICLWP